MTKIRGGDELCRAIVGYDANALYIGGKLTFDFGERYLGKERFFDNLISIFRHYILHKPVVNVCSE